MARHPLRTRDDVMQYLLEFTDYEKITSHKYSLEEFNLDRVEQLMAAVGSPHRALRSLHVAGTKGKGSTTAMAQAILTAAGLRTGSFTSPHLVHIAERMTVDGLLMSDEELAGLANTLVPYTDRARRERPEESPTYFELVTAMGFLHFVRRQVDAAVVEVGMGGRLDATNVILPEVSLITRIDFDHVERLGKTLSKIAFEKGGIIKPGVPVVVSEQAPEALGTLAALAHQRRAPLTLIGRDVALDFSGTGLDARGAYCRFSVATPRRRYPALEVRLMGRHQAMNAATAVAAVEIFAERTGRVVPEEAVRAGLAAARCPARMEYFPGPPPLLLDGAHNPVSIRALRELIDTVFTGRPVVLLMGVARDKDTDTMLQAIIPRARCAVFTRSDNPRAADPEALCAQCRGIAPIPCEAEPDAFRALDRARRLAGPDALLCVTGSLYLAGKLRPALAPQEYAPAQP